MSSGRVSVSAQLSPLWGSALSEDHQSNDKISNLQRRNLEMKEMWGILQNHISRKLYH